jgi:hypothetical protein
VAIPKSRSVSSRETGGLETVYKAGKHTNFHQLNGRKILVVFNSAIGEGLRLSRPVSVFDDFKRHPKRDIFERICFGSTVYFSAAIIGIF